MNVSQQADAAQLKDRAYSRQEVAEILRSVLGTIVKDQGPTTKLHKELSTLATYIDNMRSELAELRSAEISKDHIPSASDELDAVVEETAKATGTIMDCCDKIQSVGATLPAPASDDLTAAVTAIFEACTFQDITGQRINKVVKTLKHIESKVGDIIKAFGHTDELAPSDAVAATDEKSLLNGPQLKGAASTQEDIDKLLANFD